jgi:hypothetical protein
MLLLPGRRCHSARRATFDRRRWWGRRLAQALGLSALELSAFEAAPNDVQRAHYCSPHCILPKDGIAVASSDLFLLRHRVFLFFFSTHTQPTWHRQRHPHHHHLSIKGLVCPGLAQSARTIPKTSERVYWEALTPSLVMILMSLRRDPHRALLQREVMST